MAEDKALARNLKSYTWEQKKKGEKQWTILEFCFVLFCFLIFPSWVFL